MNAQHAAMFIDLMAVFRSSDMPAKHQAIVWSYLRAAIDDIESTDER